MGESNTSNKHRAFLAEVEKRIMASAKKPWPCMCPGCKEKAIISHLLQQHGILDFASESHQYLELKHKSLLKSSEDKFSCEFKKAGITQTLSFPVFCNDHDTKLFERIEKGTPDLDDYISQLLFCFRTICGDLRKVKIVLDGLVSLHNDNMLIDCEMTDKHVSDTYSAGLHLQDYYNELIDELNNPSGSYCFRHFTYPKIDVYASASFGDQWEISLPKGIMLCNTILFVHIIPQRDTLEILFGYPKNHTSLDDIRYVESWGNLDKTQLGLQLTELFANKIENFGIGQELYNRIPKEDLDRFRRFVTENSYYGSPRNKHVDFNLFENV